MAIINKSVFLQLLAMYFVHAVVEAKKLEDYCWREFEGEMPPDAFLVSGKSKNGKAVYVGQALFKEKLISGKIYEGDNKIYVEYFDVEYSTEANVKILCSHAQERFEWTPVSNTGVLRMNNKVFIKGGFEPNCDSYIGRVETDGEVLPGKVICCTGVEDCYGLYTSSNGKGALHTNFEILTYNEYVNKTTDIDVRVTVPEKSHGKCKQIVVNVFN